MTYLVKTFLWKNGKILHQYHEFDLKEDAVNFARYNKFAETIKVYDEQGLVYSQLNFTDPLGADYLDKYS